jgi:hypothetical protein
MPASQNTPVVPDGYVRLEGSERRRANRAKLVGQVDANERFKVTISLRRRKDGPPLPDLNYFTTTPPKLRKRVSEEEFAENYGAHPDDVKAVVQFAEQHGLTVVKTRAGRRAVEVEGTAGQFSKAFGVSFARYEMPARATRREKLSARPKTFRGREGFVYVPKELVETIVGVFGLDNRPISLRASNAGEPPVISPITVQRAMQLYNFPPSGAAISEQTIGVIAPTSGYGGYYQSDIDASFSYVGLTPPQVINVSVEPGVNNGTFKATTIGTAPAGASTVTLPLTTELQASEGFYVYPAPGIPNGAFVSTVTPAGANATVGLSVAFAAGGVPSGTVLYFDGSPDATGETNQDICICGMAGAGANVACYFTSDTQAGWVDLINRVLQPEPGDFPAGVNPPTVLTASWGIAPGDDPDGITYADLDWGTGVTTSALIAMNAAFQDAAVLQSGPTICICTGDYGSNQGVGRSASPSAATTQISTTLTAAQGVDVLTFSSTSGVPVGSFAAYADAISGVWYFLKVTAVTATTLTVQVLDNATQSWGAGGLYDTVPAGTPIYVNLQFSGDGYAHVWYPGSDPWVLSVGGTTLGQYYPSGSSTPAWVEYAWNDASNYPSGIHSPGEWGTGGGGVSGYFPLPSYQQGAGVPNSINPTLPTNSDLVSVTPSAPFNATGRGTPDVAANASIYSGFSGFFTAGVQTGWPANGTSASTPFWAGLIAVLNSNTGFNIGFVNPTLYALGAGSTAFNALNPLWRDPAFPQLANCPLDNSNNGIAGYPTGPGWDACTGLGSPNGVALLTAFTELESVYIMGGYQSPDIIITDLTTNQPIPIGGQPDGRWDTLLEPSTNYGFSANVHNDSSITATGVVVSFWAIPGGVGTNGSMVGTPQTVSIPPHSTVNVPASAPFVSAPPGEHLCAVVSLYGASAGCNVDATTALEIPSPGYSDTHQCSAWRNTDSMIAGPGGRFGFHIGLGAARFHLEEPVLLEIDTRHVPVAWTQNPVALGIADTLRAVGAKSNLPLYLLPGLRQNLETVPVNPRVKATHGLELKEREPGVWLLSPDKRAKTTSLEISGEVPKSAQKGDVLLVNVTATYPGAKGKAARTVDFLEFVYVGVRKKER